MDYLNDPIWLSRMGNTLNVGGQFMSAFSHLQFGVMARRAADAEAAQLRINAGQAQAASQLAAQDVEQRTKQLASRALAVAAASGGGASDPNVVNAISSIAGEGAYRKAVALYQGEERARELEGAADAAQYRGRATQFGEGLTAVGGAIGATASGLRGGARTNTLKAYERDSSLRTKYGGAGPLAATTPSDNYAPTWASGMDY